MFSTHLISTTCARSLHAFAPVCLAFLAVMILPIEGVEPFRRLANLGLPLIIVK